MKFSASFGNSKIYEQGDFEIHETELKVKGITKPLTINVYSDIHIAYTDRRDDVGRRNFVLQRRIFFPGAPDVMEQAVTFNKNTKPDFTVLTGDIIDFPSEKNLEVLNCIREEGFGPYLYHLGNHDYNFPHEKDSGDVLAEYRRRIDEFALDSLNVFRDVTPEECKTEAMGFHAVDLGEIIIAGGENITSAGISSIKLGLEKLSSLNKPVILCVHLPFHSETLDPDVIKVWRRCTSLKNVDEYLALNENLVAAFSGDVHFFSNNMAGGKIPQIVTTSTEDKIPSKDRGNWPFYFSGMSIVKLIPD